MESAKNLARIGNILQTIWFVLLIIASFGVSALKAAGAITAGHSLGIFGVIILIVLMVLCWKAQSNLDQKNWRLFLLIEGIVTIFIFTNLIAGILFIIASIKANKEA